MTIITPKLELYVPSTECTQQYIDLAKKAIINCARQHPELGVDKGLIESGTPSLNSAQEEVAELINGVIDGSIDRNLALEKRLPFKICDANGKFYSHAKYLIKEGILSEIATEAVPLIGRDLHNQVKERENIGQERHYQLYVRSNAVHCQIDPNYSLPEPPPIGQPLEVIYDLEL